MSMYNNEVTYADKWKTPENEAAKKKLEDKFFDRSECGPDCPLSWAVEVLELFETLDREVGIRLNEGSLRGYMIQGKPLEWFVIGPWKHAYKTFSYFFLEKKSEYYTERGLSYNLKQVLGAFWQSIRYGLRASRVLYLNPRLNRFSKAKMGLSQVKEKFGTLRVYFGAPRAFNEFIESEIRKCEVKLAAKGAYFPLESLWDWSIGYYMETDYNPDSIEVEVTGEGEKRRVDVNETVYRSHMKELGLDLKDIAEKAKIYREKNAEEA